MYKNKEMDSKLRYILRDLEIHHLSEVDLNSILYVAYLKSSDNKSLEDIGDLELRFQSKLIYSKYEDEIKKVTKIFSADELKKLILGYNNLYSKGIGNLELKDGVYKLLIDLLELEDFDSVAQIQSDGFSKFEYLTEEKKCRLVDLYEPDMQKVLVYKIRKELLNSHVNIIESSILDNSLDIKYSKILNPMNFRRNISEEEMWILKKNYSEINRISKRSDGLVDILSSLLYLEETGKLVSLIRPVTLYSGVDKNIREYLIEEGLIESVISLPENLIQGSGIGTSVLVISKGNRKVNFIDAEEIYTSINKYERDLSEENIESILSLIGKQTDISIAVSLDEIKEKDYLLDPTRYLNEISFEKEVRLEEVVESIDRGNNITSRDLEMYRSNKRTNYRFLNLVDIQDGRIKDTAISLKKNAVEANKRLSDANKLKKGQLLLSRTGNPIRIAVVEDIEDETWFYNGNIYSISLDFRKYNPYYLKVFLESELGMELLNQISMGSVIPNINMKDLKEIKLPDVDIEEQNKVANIYISYEKKIRLKEKELEKLKADREKELSVILSGKEIGLCN